MKKIVTILILVTIGYSLFSQNVGMDEAEIIAKNFLSGKNNNTQKSVLLVSEEYSSYNEYGEMLYHVINFEEGGFVIVSGDKRTEPILAYSPTNTFKLGETNPAASFWIQEYYVKGITNIKRTDAKATPEMLQKWNNIATGKQHKTYAPEVKPLLTSQWNQDKYYNALCPVDNAGTDYDDHVPNGCVAVAMAQLMYYHRFPRRGNGNDYYTGTYGQQKADFGATTYNYEAMNDIAIGYSDALARLIYHAGVSVRMDYAKDGSGAQSNDVLTALQNYFLYDPSMRMLERDTTGNIVADSAWKDSIKSSLNAGLPVYYAAASTASGGRDARHAFICDGYDQNDRFHFNWGWGGSSNGYFSLTAMDPSTYKYIAENKIIFHIKPKSDTTNFFDGQKVLTATYGSFNDGSGHLNYRDNTNCSWLISPQGGKNVTKITLTVSTFSLGNGDSVQIYKGNSIAAANLVATLKGDVAQGISYTIDSSEAVVSFTSDNNNTGEGFIFNYSSTLTSSAYCNTSKSTTGTNKLIVETSQQGSINNGSGNANYDDQNDCYWAFSPEGTTSGVQFGFSKFDIGKGDVVEILQYHNTSIASAWGYYANGVYRFSLDNKPQLNKLIYKTDENVVLVHFRTDNDSSATGFEIYWGSNGIQESEAGLAKLSVYPNPANDYVLVDMTATAEETVQIAVYDMVGKVLFATLPMQITGQHTEKIQTTDFAKGLYFVRIVTNKGVATKKLSIK
jgi:hypothetical protein